MASFAAAALGRQRDRRHVELELHRLLELGLQQREHAFRHEVGANARRLLGRAQLGDVKAPPAVPSWW
jgi:hypothetical protein